MNQRKRPKALLPTDRQISDGCFIDFEGFAPNEHRAHPPPVLMGIMGLEENGKFEQIVFTGAYRWAAELSGVDNEVHFIEDRRGYLENLIQKVSGGRKLFAYSEHEQLMIQAITERNLVKRYVNVRRVAKRWMNQRKHKFE